MTCRAIVPPFILRGIAERGTDEQKVVAIDTLLLSEHLRTRREMAPVPSPQHLDAEDREIYDAHGKRTKGTKVRSEHDGPTGNQDVDEAYDATGNTYGLYLDVFGRHSIDDQGLPLISTVNYDKDFDNAFWDGTQMWYGKGKFFNAFTRDLTVPGHELTHGVTEKTAGLQYQDQPGALNEHISDAFGMMVEQYAYRQSVTDATWLIGAKLCEGKVQRGPAHPERLAALRDALYPGDAYSDPVIGQDPQGADMAHYDDTQDDNGGVHINSGIPNRAFAEACLHRGGLSWEGIGEVWYRVLTGGQLRPTAQFTDFASLTYAQAGITFGDGSPEKLAVLHGWQVVGIDPSGVPSPAPAPPPGSPCQAELMELLALVSGNPRMTALARRFLARVRATIGKA